MKDDESEMDEAKGRRKPKKVEGAGWVVEIRGYTDHKQWPAVHQEGAAAEPPEHRQVRGGKDEKKIGKYIVGVPDPVKGKVSHAFIYKYWQVNDASANSFVNINASPLDGILGGGSGGDSRRSGGPSMAGPMAPPSDLAAPAANPATPAASLGPVWSGLTSSGSGGGTLTTAAAMSPSPIAPPTTGGAQTPSAGGKDDRRRFEFVVMLIWREPVPKIEPNPDAALPAARANVTRSLTDAPTEPAERGRALGVE